MGSLFRGVENESKKSITFNYLLFREYLRMYAICVGRSMNQLDGSGCNSEFIAQLLIVAIVELILVINLLNGYYVERLDIIDCDY